ncbi:MAG TPA: carboxypeptidase regulatory-like domain-containing protein [Candidatus Methylomirabilis sp.]|nr:carboxypeptidase regulatory-like domain-containing protein [Candidatus Methylomirabilis sp.]
MGRLATTIRCCYTWKALFRAAVIGGFLLLCCPLGLSPATAADALVLGTQWLTQTQLPNGAWDGRLEVPATALAMRRLMAMGQDVAADQARLRALLLTDLPSQAWQYWGTRDASLLPALLAHQQSDGSLSGDLVATALVAWAQAEEGSANGSAVAFLRAAVNPDGGWGAGGTSTAWDTTLTLLALLRSGTPTSDPLAAAGVAWIERHQGLLGEVGSTGDTAIALLALLAAGQAPAPATETTPANASQKALDFLLATVATDGSWGRDEALGGVGTTALAILALAAAQPTAPEIAQGQAFLAGTRAAGGGWREAGTAVPVTAAAVEALQAIDPVDPAIAPALSFLQSSSKTTGDAVARAFAVSGGAPTDLLALQNSDGGWGLEAGFGSEPWTTALGLRALAMTGNGSSSNTTQAVNWLLDTRLDDGGWGYASGEASRVAVTADVVRALAGVPRNLDIQATLNRALTLFQGKRGADGGYGDTGSTPLETGLVVRALATAGADLAPITPPTLAYLTTNQQADGSWEGDPYITAIALQAVWLLQNPPVRPTTGGVSAQVLNAVTGQALAGVTARRYGEATSVLTDAFGRFSLDGLPAGSVTLEFSKGGYLTQMGMVTVTVGLVTPLGTIRLVSAPTTASVSGRVTDAAAGTVLAGVTVTATGGAGTLTATTGVDGGYSISGVMPGTLTLMASKAGYQDASATGTAVAGVTIQFSPALPPVGQAPPTTATVRGTVLDAITRAPLAGATLSLGTGGSGTTDAAGLVTLIEVPAGTYSGTVSAGGYISHGFTAVLPGGSSLDLGTVLLTSLTAPGSLMGLVVDAATNQALAGARLALAGNTAVTATTLASGVVTLPDLPPGRVDFTLTKDGYSSLSGFATIAPAATTDLEVLRLSPLRTTAAIRGTVTDGATGAALAGVAVQVAGTVPLSATTNAAGSYELADVQPGEVTITASKAGYAPASATTTLVAGAILTFSPVLGAGADTGEGGALVGSALDGGTGEPFAGATVRLVGDGAPSTTTSATGAFSLPLYVDRPWVFYIEATAPGYLGETRYIAVFPDAPTYLAPFILARPGAGRLAGRVVAVETETPLAGVTLNVLGSQDSTVTDESGAFLLTGLDAGALSLALSKPGYGTARVDTAVSRIGTTAVGDLFLAALGAPPGADLALFPEDLVVNPAVPQPGNLVSVTAVVRNLGTTDAAGRLQLYAGNPNLGGSLLTSAPVTVGATFRQTVDLPSVTYPADRPQLFVVVSGVEPPDVDPRNNVVTPGRPPAAMATSALDAVKWLVSHQIPITSTQGAWTDHSVPYLNSLALRAYYAMGQTTAPQYQPAMTKMLEAQGPDGNFAGVSSANCILALLDTGEPASSSRIQDAVAYLRRIQNTDGSWAWGGRGFAGRADVTGMVLAALIQTGTPKTDSAVVRAVTWLRTTQNTDGYWGDQAGAASNPFVSTYAVVGLALATSTTESAVTRAKTYYDGWRAYNQEFLRNWLLMMRTLNPSDGLIPSSVSSLLTYQRPDGGWSLSGYNYTDFQLTAEVVAIVRGLGFVDGRLMSGLNWVSAHINANGESFPANQSVSPTGWATTGLETSPLTADGKTSAITKARTTLVATQQGDGSWPNPIPPSYAPFIDPTALATMALSVPPSATWTSSEQTAIGRAVSFLRNAQKKSGVPGQLGGWPSYYYDALVTQGSSINALLALLQAGFGVSDPEVSRGLTWLAGQQLPDGSWANSQDTALAAVIFQRAGVYPDRVQRAITWLLANQNPNGGWGTVLGQSSGSSRSALAVMALSGAGERGLPVARGVCYVQSVQRADGSWGGPTGTGQVLWALTGAQVNQQVTLSLALSKAVYYPGDTIQMTVTAQGLALDQLALQGTVSPQEGEVVAITFGREADRFVATYAVPGSAIPGTWAVSVIGTGPSGESGVACATLPVKNPVGNAPDLAILPSDIAFAGETGGAVTISASVRNLQPIDATGVLVRFYDGDPNGSGAVLGQSTLSRIEGGGIGLATLAWSPPGQRDIYVKADPDNQVAETEEGNNLAFRTFVPVGGSAPPTLTLALDRAEYPAATDLQIALSVGNPRAEASDFSVRLVIETAGAGEAIAALPDQSMTGLAPGEARNLGLTWNTGTTPTGQYTVRGTLRDATGATVTSRLVLFRIVAGDGSQTTPQITSRVTTDRQTYDANQTATISVTATNTTTNAAWYNLLVSVEVQDSAGTRVWTASQAVASLPAQASRTLGFAYGIGSATPGTYTVVERVTDPGNGVLLDAKITTFQVASSAVTGAGLVGTLTATPSAAYRNAAVELVSAIRNSGNAPMDLAGLHALIMNPQTQAVVQTLPLQGGTLAVGAERVDGVTVPGENLPATAASTSYVAILQALVVGGGTRTLASAPISVVDRAPLFDAVGLQTVNEGQTLTVTVRATDPDGDAVTLSAGTLPANATFEPATGTLTFAPDFLQAGTYVITIAATDGILPTTRTIDISVPNTNQAPMLSPLVNLVVNEGEIVHLAILATDPDGTGSLTLDVTNLPPCATFIDLGGGQGTLRLAPGFADAGRYPGIAVTVADHDATNPLGDTKTFDLTVPNVNRPPVLQPIANQSLAEGGTLDVQVAAGDPDGNGMLRLTLENAPAFVTLTDEGSGRGTLHLAPGYTDAGAYAGITARVTDQDAVAPLDAVQTFTVTVGNVNRAPQVTPIPNQTVAEGDVLDVPVLATDPDGLSNLTLGLLGAPAFVTLTDHGSGQGTLRIAPVADTAATYLNLTVIASDHDSVVPLEGRASFRLIVTPSGPLTLPATLNIDPDTLNRGSNGKWITAYIELPTGYDPAVIAVATVALTEVNGQPLPQAIHAQPSPVAIGDQNGNGIADLMVKFSRSAVQQVVADGDHIVLSIEGALNNGQAFSGSDTIRVIH